MIIWSNSEEKPFWSANEKKALIETRWLMLGWIAWAVYATILLSR